MAEERYDFVIVGAGSAGCVLANRLSAEGARVLLLEAGPRDWHPLIAIPLGSAALLRNRRVSWDLPNAPEPAMPGREIFIPRGKVLGGSSSLNALSYVRGHPRDYDDWHRLGCPGWSYADVLPYFKRSERYQKGADAWRGGAGALEVRTDMSDHPLYEAFLEAGRQAGHPFTPDYNGAQQEGLCRMQHTVTLGPPAAPLLDGLRVPTPGPQAAQPGGADGRPCLAHPARGPTGGRRRLCPARPAARRGGGRGGAGGRRLSHAAASDAVRHRTARAPG